MLDKSYIDGLEQGIEIVKVILSLDTESRKAKFGSSNIATILDRFDFAQLNEMVSKKSELKRYYVIRGIKTVDFGKKKVVCESARFNVCPTETTIENFMRMANDRIDFATVEEIYVYE